MDQKEFERELDKRIKQLNTAKLIYPVATAIHDNMINRIFDSGIDGADSQIGQYSTTPAYFTRGQFNKGGAFKPRGKESKKRKFKNGKDRTSMYLPEGYKELKQIQGYQSKFVNAQYTGDLRKDLSTKLTLSNGRVIWIVSRALNQEKVGWLIEKYGAKTFEHTPEEIEFFKEEVTKKITEYFSFNT